MKRILFFFLGIALAAAGLALSWRLLIELIGLVLLVIGLAIAATSLFGMNR
ncbi:MAG: hypothetical protein QXF45_08290 [Candidatus Caldarchaeum sp.]